MIFWFEVLTKTFSFQYTTYHSVREKCPNSEFLLVLITQIQTEYGHLQNEYLYSVQMRQMKTRKISKFKHFLCSDCVFMFLQNPKLFNIVFARLSMIYGYHTMQENLVWKGKWFSYRRSDNIFGNLKTRLLQLM